MKLLLLPFLVLAAAASAADPAYNWQNVRIGGGGYLLGAVAHPKEPGLMYVRADVGGCYRFDAETRQLVQLMNWVPAEQSNLYGVAGLALDPSDVEVVYIAAGKYPDKTPSGVFRSRDRGETWEPMGLEKPFPGNKNPHRQGNRLAVNPHRPGDLWCGTFGEGLWRFDGKEWRRVADVPAGVDVQTVVFDPQDAAMIYVGVHGEGVFRSCDGGASFAKVGAAPVKTSDLSLSATGSTLYLSAWEQGIHRLRAAKTGAVWEDISPDKVKFRTVTASPHDDGVVMTAKGEYGSLSHFYISTDGGTTWQQRKDKETRQTIPWHGRGYPGSAISQITFDPRDAKRVWFTDWYSLWRTDDWTASPIVWTNEDAAGHEEVVCVVLSGAHPANPAGAWLHSGHADVNGFTHTDLKNYPQANVSLSGVEKMQEITGIDFAESDPKFVVMLGGIGWGTKQGLLATSHDGGLTWQAQAGFDESWGAGRVAVHGKDARHLVAATQAGGVVFSTDGGGTWQASAGAPAARDLALGGVFNYHQILTTDRAGDAFHLYAPRTGQMYRSTDGGKAFTATAKLPSSSAGVIYLRGSHTHSGHLWLARGGDLRRSNDGGETWSTVDAFADASMVTLGQAAPDAPQATIYVWGMREGETTQACHRSTDDGATWQRLNDDNHRIGNVPQALAADRAVFGRVFIGTNGSGVWSGEITQRRIPSP